MTGEQIRETVNYFKNKRICLVSVDAPKIEHFTATPNFDYLTTEKLFYLRAHGKNAEAYIKGKTVQDRFNHDYSDWEIENISKRLGDFDKQAPRIFAIFNNNCHRYAPDAAKQLYKSLRARFPQKVSAPKGKEPTLF